MAPHRRRPAWWEWDVELSTHVERRMPRREFNEVELRAMLQRAERIRRDHVEGRFIVEARYRRRAWHVIVEPDHERMCILVITAYPVST